MKNTVDMDRVEREIQLIEADIQQTNYRKPIKLGDLVKKQYPQIEWIIEQLVPAEGLVVISGQPSAYKTWFILELAIKVASGEYLFERFVTSKNGVLIIDEETGERWIKQRIVMLTKYPEINIHLLSKSGFKLTDESVQWLKEYCLDNSIKLILFDSLVRIHTAKDENSAMEMGQVASLFQKLTNAGLTVIFTHHNRKPSMNNRSYNPSQELRGSSDILASVDCHLVIDRKEKIITVTQSKLRQAEEVEKFNLAIVSNDYEFKFEYMGEIHDTKNKKNNFQDAIVNILEVADKPLYKKEIFDLLKDKGFEGEYSTYKESMKGLVDKNIVSEARGEKNKVFCQLVNRNK